MRRPTLLPPSDLPASGAVVPAFLVRVALAAIGLALTFVDYGLTFWVVIGVVLAIAAARAPQYLFSWTLMLFLAAGLLRHHTELTWQFLVLLAGLHLLHITSMLALELPRRSWVQPVVFLAPLARFIAIEVPAQVVAVVALLLLAPNSAGHRPLTVAPLSVVGALALAGLALVLLRPRPALG